MLWNPLQIDPQLSDLESCDEEAPFNTPAESDEYPIECTDLDTLNGSEEAIQSERFLKMSHISARRSNSASSNMQACEELVHGLENGNQPQKNSEIQIIKAKILPEEGSSQIQICELVTNSLDLTNHDASGHLGQATGCTNKSGDTTQITRVISESQKSDSLRVDKMLQIGIAKNYSFLHEPEPNGEGRPDSIKGESGECLGEARSTKWTVQQSLVEDSSKFEDPEKTAQMKLIKEEPPSQKNLNERGANM